MPTACRHHGPKSWRPPTSTTVVFSALTTSSASIPDPDPGVVDVIEITSAEMTQVINFFAGLSITYGGNLTGAEIKTKVTADTPVRLKEELGSEWGTIVNGSEADQGGWGPTSATWVHPTKNGKVVYSVNGSNYDSAKIQADRG